MATATMGIGLGVIIGPPFGGLTYAYAGKQWPFFILAMAGACSFVVQLWLLSRKTLRERIARTALAAKLDSETSPPVSILTLLRDVNIRRGAVALIAQNAVIASIEPAFPIWAGEWGETSHTCHARRMVLVLHLANRCLA